VQVIDNGTSNALMILPATLLTALLMAYRMPDDDPQLLGGGLSGVYQVVRGTARCVG